MLLHLSRRRQRRAHRHRAGGRAPGRLRQPPARPAFGLSLATQGRGRGRGPAAGHKTSAEAYPALQERLRQLHPYELPELLAVEAASGLPEYLQWLAAESRPVN
ncbi:divalent cation tolerance protein CutA [Klebsiella pneumoniae]